MNMNHQIINSFKICYYLINLMVKQHFRFNYYIRSVIDDYLLLYNKMTTNDSLIYRSIKFFLLNIIDL